MKRRVIKMKMLGKLIILVVLFLSIAAPVEAQFFKKGVKIGYVDIAKVFDQYKRTDTATEDLKKDIEEKKKDIEAKKDAVNLVKQKLETQGMIINKEEKARMEEEVETEISELKDLTEKFNRELRQRENQLIRNILKDIREAINIYGKDKGYDLILDKREVLYGPEGMDVTDNIVDIINKKSK